MQRRRNKADTVNMDLFISALVRPTTKAQTVPQNMNRENPRMSMSLGFCGYAAASNTYHRGCLPRRLIQCLQCLMRSPNPCLAMRDWWQSASVLFTIDGSILLVNASASDQIWDIITDSYRSCIHLLLLSQYPTSTAENNKYYYLLNFGRARPQAGSTVRIQCDYAWSDIIQVDKSESEFYAASQPMYSEVVIPEPWL